MRIIFIYAMGLLLTAISLSACQEEYFARLDNLDPVLVVDGLITNNSGPHKVRLSLSNRFQDEAGANPVSGASLVIEAGDGVLTELSEDPTATGTYLTPAEFTGVPGQTYTLHIQTPDGEKFQSIPQTMNDPVNIDSVFIEEGRMLFYRKSNMSNTMYTIRVEGVNVFLHATPEDDNDAFFRFRSLNYMQWIIPVGDASYWSCWWQWDVTNFYGADLGKASRNEPVSQQVGFIPFSSNDFFYFGYNHTEDSLEKAVVQSVRVLTNDIYTLNGDSYAFHKAKNEQLNNEGRFFDPIASQPYGNIRCISDPEKRVLGIFEVSSMVRFSHRLVTNFEERTIHIQRLDSFNPDPAQGMVFTAPPNYPQPAWWIR